MSDPRLDGDLPDLDRATVEAVGKLSEAFETIEVARGHLYNFHQLSGRADFLLGDAVRMLRDAGEADLADRIDEELLGRNVLFGRWTFQVMEEYDDGYYATFRGFEEESRALTAGQRHVYEATLKRDRRTPGRPGHERSPEKETS